MAQNPVQFQKGLSLKRFLSDYGTEEQCEQTLEDWRWRNGFVCPSCHHQQEPVRLRTRALLQCRHCHHQASLTAGTLFANNQAGADDLAAGDVSAHPAEERHRGP